MSLNRNLFYFVFFFVLMFIGNFALVSAQGIISEGVGQFVRGMGELISPFFELILNTSSYDEFFFAKSLLLILLFVIVLTAVKRIHLFEKQKGISFIIAGVVSILSVRYISDDGFISGILIPYGSLGIAITTFLPLLIYFFFVHQSVPGNFGRRAAWILYGIIFLFLWGSRSADLNNSSNWIYLSGLAFVLVSFVWDSSIHSYFGLSDIKRLVRHSDDRRMAQLLAEYHNLSNISGPTVDRVRESLKEEIERLGGKID